MSLNQPLLLSSALVHQVLLSPTTYPYKPVGAMNFVRNTSTDSRFYGHLEFLTDFCLAPAVSWLRWLSCTGFTPNLDVIDGAA